MAASLTDPAVLLALAAGGAGAFLLIQARLQARLLRRRIATGAGTVAVDASTGLWSAAAAWQCIRAEANRALRLGRPLDVWIGATDDVAALDERGRELGFDLPAGSMAVRLDGTHVCVVSCAGSGEAVLRVAPDFTWRSTSIEPNEHAAAEALAFVSTERDDHA